MYRIGQLARLAHVTPDTVRYYEKRGLMGHDTRTEGGFRLYNPAELQRLRFIRHARQVGFTLDAIAELLSIRIDPQHHTCEESKKIVERRLQDVDDMIAELQTMQRSLRRLSDACCGGMHDSRHCSILEILEQGSDVPLTHRRT
ncbi:Zn(2+)-responsive transcriptional regulator [Pantoea sp. 1.19]|uniref:Zn(2+)-responsive transcriptional regulator n=1 Tax=Pantoea sp. 1.19 TaxID=1925589 RepID=UPI000948F8E6|nr:Zn(2+)-responsive transcriptional regulator [Pantoea sp. 1.19]